MAAERARREVRASGESGGALSLSEYSTASGGVAMRPADLGLEALTLPSVGPSGPPLLEGSGPAESPKDGNLAHLYDRSELKSAQQVGDAAGCDTPGSCESENGIPIVPGGPSTTTADPRHASIAPGPTGVSNRQVKAAEEKLAAAEARLAQRTADCKAAQAASPPTQRSPAILSSPLQPTMHPIAPLPEPTHHGAMPTPKITVPITAGDRHVIVREHSRDKSAATARAASSATAKEQAAKECAASAVARGKASKAPAGDRASTPPRGTRVVTPNPPRGRHDARHPSREASPGRSRQISPPRVLPSSRGVSPSRSGRVSPAPGPSSHGEGSSAPPPPPPGPPRAGRVSPPRAPPRTAGDLVMAADDSRRPTYEDILRAKGHQGALPRARPQPHNAGLHGAARRLEGRAERAVRLAENLHSPPGL
jgi:hypothetical protein